MFCLCAFLTIPPQQLVVVVVFFLSLMVVFVVLDEVVQYEAVFVNRDFCKSLWMSQSAKHHKCKKCYFSFSPELLYSAKNLS